jgi:hypothetical protein
MVDPSGRSGGVVVFAGPSLPARPDAAWRSLLDRCELRPPARRGDVLAALARHPRTIVLVDGYYFTVPAVTHKELLYALDAGVRVIGAASLGALRAAELEPFGMTGVGEVFARYRSGEIEGDDEVALLHAAEEHGYRPLTVALVEVRHAVDRLESAGTCAAAPGRRLVAELKAISFLDRFPDRVAELARRCLGAEAAAELGRLLRAAGVKQDDARRALVAALEETDGPSPAGSGPPRPLSGYLGFYKEAHLLCPPIGSTDTVESPSLLQAWRMAQIFHPEAVGFVREIRRRSLLAAAAVRAGVAVPAGDVRSRAGELRRLHGPLRGGPFLPLPEYEEEARFEILAREACRAAGGAAGALDRLAGALGLAGGDEETLSRLVAGGGSSIPTWWLVRAFSLRPAFPAAVAAAVAAGEVHRCFLCWADGARIAGDDLHRLAAGLWHCAPEEVPREAARRGIGPSALVGDGLRDALERIAAAERLPAAINGYPEARDALARAPLALAGLEA